MGALLVVEDEFAIGHLLESKLRANHHDVEWVTTGKDAIVAADGKKFDLVLLDLGLPDLDGFDVCRQLRATQPECVLVILTASDAEIDVVVALEAGADDYLTKPFRVVEIVARIRAHLRRHSTMPAPTRVFRVGSLVVDAQARRARIEGHNLDGRDIDLRAREFDLLARLASEPGTALSRSTLIADVWGSDWPGSEKNLDVTISALRRKLELYAENTGTAPPEIVTLRGRGYRLEQGGS